MNLLSQNPEIMLRTILKKYEKNHNYVINGDYDELPEHFSFAMKNIMNELESCGYISRSMPTMGCWTVVITPEALEYFEKKGSRVELFEELVESEKSLLSDLIKIEKEDGDLSEYMQNKLQNDPKDITRGILGKLASNGLVSLFWADDTVCEACLTQAGRSFFEREKKYNERMEKLAGNTYNFGNIHADNSNFIIGNVINSTLNIDNSVSMIEQKIDEKCETEAEKIELKTILKEAKEIVDSIKESKHIEKRTSFVERLSTHFQKHGWFYSSIIGLFGQAMTVMLNGQ